MLTMLNNCDIDPVPQENYCCGINDNGRDLFVDFFSGVHASGHVPDSLTSFSPDIL